MPNNTSQDSVVLNIIVDGEDLVSKYYFISIHTSKSVNKIPVARITLHDGNTSEGNFTAADSSDFHIGSSIEIKSGYQKDINTIFKGEITKLTISAYGTDHSVLVVECRDVAYRTTLRRRNIAFQAVTDSECISKILEHYSDINKSIEPTTIRHEALLQQNISDWDYINLRAEANGKVIICSDGHFKVKKIDTNSSPAKEFTYGENIIEIEMKMDCRNQILSAEVKSWNSDDLTNVDTESSDISEQSFGDVSYKTLAQKNKNSKEIIYHEGTTASNEMKSLADAMVEFSRLAKIQGKITVEGESDLILDKIIKITKGSLHFQGHAYVSGINHIIIDGGWKTELIIGIDNTRYMHKYPDLCTLPATGVISPTNGLQIGKVKKIFGDPKENHRVFVNLPMIHKSEEGIWCRLSSAYASDGVGFVFFPEVDSEVVVGFVNDDPRSPIILGSMYGKKHKTPAQIDEKNSKKTITTKNKLQLSFDEINKVILLEIEGSEKRSIAISDKDGAITLSNGTGGKIILGKNGIEISSSTDIKLTANGSIKLNAKAKLELESTGEAELKGMALKLEGQTTASLEGAIKAEIKSTGETVVKGTIVMIN